MAITVRKPTPAEKKEAEGWGIWEKEPSEFDWSYSEKETCHILEGKATVKGKDGSSTSFGAGDYVIFPQGLECTWKIEKKIRKRYKFG
jgi:uncharacterized cupin superfamily protein